MARDVSIYLEAPKAGAARAPFWVPSQGNDFVIRFAGKATDPGSEWLQSILDRLLRPNSADPHSPIPSIYEDDAFVVVAGSDPRRTIKARVLLSSAAKQKQVVGSIRFSGTEKWTEHGELPPLHWDGDFRVSVERKPDEDKKLQQTLRNKSKYVFAPDSVSDVILKQLGIIGADDQHYDLGFKIYKQFATQRPNPPGSSSPEPTASSTPDPSATAAIPFPPALDAHPAGLIVVAGGTGTGKSTYARGIILRYLLRLGMQRVAQLLKASKPLSEYSPPHLVSFEDPIESWTLQSSDTYQDEKKNSFDLLEEPESDLRCGIRLTCRAKTYDVDSLGNACLHALRQKPNVVYIGECREAKDWNLALELGGTGHLVVTTCHSSSLVDTFVKLASSSGRDAQGRQSLASALRGVLHLKSAKFEPQKAEAIRRLPSKEREEFFSNFSADQTYFSLWKNTSESVSNFVVDGLSSLIIDEDNIISRSTLSRLILEHQEEDPRELLNLQGHVQSKREYFHLLRDIAAEMAFKLDLGQS